MIINVLTEFESSSYNINVIMSNTNTIEFIKLNKSNTNSL